MRGLKYQVVYISLSGNTERLAKELYGILPRESTRLVNLCEDDADTRADVYLIGFGYNQGRIPLMIIELLEQLSGKTVLLFATCGLLPTEEYRDAIAKKLFPFLPDDCDWRGLYLCGGAFPNEVAENLEQLRERGEENEQVQMFWEAKRETDGHPDEGDVEEALAFVRKALYDN